MVRVGFAQLWALLSIAVALLGHAEIADAHESRRAITSVDILGLRDLDGLSISPDGEWCVFQIRQADAEENRYDLNWHLLPTNGMSSPLLVAGGGEPIQPKYLGRVNGVIRVTPPRWRPDGRGFIFLKREHGRVQVWQYLLGGEARQMSSNDGDVTAATYSRDARRMLFEVEPSLAQVRAALAAEGLRGYLYDGRFFPSYSQIPVLAEEPVRTPRGQIWVVDVETGEERPASPDEQQEFRSLIDPAGQVDAVERRGDVALGADGGLAWSEALNPQFQGGLAPLTVVARPASADGRVVCVAPECTGQRLRGIWWRSENEVLFARGEGPLLQDTALYSWAVGEHEPRLILRTPDRFEWECSVAHGRLICFYEQPDHPRRLVAIDLDTGSITTLYDPNADFSRLELGPAPRRLHFVTETGVETFGYLVLPPQARRGRRLPLVIVTYRCAGFLRGGVGDEYPIYAFAAEGFAVLCFNIPVEDYSRLAAEMWDRYQTWGRGDGDPIKRRIQESLDHAVSQLAREGIIDAERVGLTGLSYGAETVHYALFNMRHLSTAIASGAEIGPSSAYLYSQDGREDLRRWGLSTRSLDRWARLSVTQNVDAVNAPLLLNVADREMVSALHVVAALEENDRPVEMYVFPDENHIKWQPIHRLAIYQRNIDWMNFWLRGEENANRPEQYQRWRLMRNGRSP